MNPSKLRGKAGKKDDWTREDFVANLEGLMKEQEIKHPKLKRVHAKLKPEWSQMTTLIQNMLRAPTQEEETGYVEKIAAFGVGAVYPLVEALLTVKKIGPIGPMKKQR